MTNEAQTLSNAAPSAQSTVCDAVGTKVYLQANQASEMDVSKGGNIVLSENAGDIKSVTTDSCGDLVVSFKDGSSFVAKNFANTPKGLMKIQTADGTEISVGNDAPVQKSDAEKAASMSPAAGDSEPTLSSSPTEKAATKAVEKPVLHVADNGTITIQMPKKGEDVVVNLAAGQDYKFAFGVNEPTSVKQVGNELVIHFKNGGEITIPNYGTMKSAGGDLVMKDGSHMSMSDFASNLASAEQLNNIEAAAGDNGGGASGGGFGFGGAFNYTPFNGLNPIGVINPTGLGYEAPDRLPNPGFNPPAPPTVNMVTGNAYVYEDSNTELTVNVTPQFATEQVTITISGIDPTWVVDASRCGGTYNAATGTWTITMPPGVAFSGGPQFFPPHNSDGDMLNLTVTSTVTNSATGLSTTSSSPAHIYTDAVADIPTVTASAAVGNEDQVLDLNITTAPTDTDGSEVITHVQISGIPDGAVLNHGVNLGGGVWQLSPADLAGLKITPPHNFAGSFDITVTTFVHETNFGGAEFDYTNNDAQNSTVLNLTFCPVAEVPTLTVQDICILEDGSGQVNVQAGVTDADDILTVTITGFHADWAVDTSLSGGIYNAATGTWTITMPRGQNFSGGPIVHPPHDSDADMTGLHVTARTSPNGTTWNSASVSANFDVHVDAVADTPLLTTQDIPFMNWSVYLNYSNVGNLNIQTQVTDTDGSEQIQYVIVDLTNPITMTQLNWGPTPTGAVSLADTGVKLSAGTEIAHGIWRIDVVNGDVNAALSGLHMSYDTPNNGTSGPWQIFGYSYYTGNITVTSYSHEINLSGEECNYGNNTAVATSNIGFNFALGSPLVLDLNGDGIGLTGIQDGVNFDMNNDGIIDRTSWVDRHDGLLALDINHDGVINNQSELFGNQGTFVNGFQTLAQYDQNNDGVIDASDAVFGQLKIWQDVNHDGISQASEMKSLSDWGIASIGLNATAGSGNFVAHGQFTYTNGQTGQVSDALFDVQQGESVVRGTTGNDVLQGTAVHDRILGGNGNDVINGGAGNDTLIGGAGHDTFVMGINGGVDIVKDFSLANDKLDISDVLTGYDPLANDLHNFVNVIQQGANTIVQVDATGTGHFQNAFVLENVHIDFNALTNNGHLITG